jgi:hypothetical protein
MYMQITIRYLLYVSLLFSITNIACADSTATQSPESPCSQEVNESYFSQYSSVKFINEVGHSAVRWLCYDGKVLLQAKPSSNGGYHVFSTYNGNVAFELLKRGKKIVRKDGYPILLRLVVQESARDNDNLYWLLDFLDKEPKVIGPFGEGAGDGSETYEVSWGKDDVAITTGSMQVYTYNFKDKKIIRVQ